ncbi:MAG: hypothetical protein HY290_16220 [Planctomycetia bacterium]|nr:hypothetical protein [Planctomycetia bacterium]
MNFTPEQVELIVQRVVEHLDATRSGPAPATDRPAALNAPAAVLVPHVAGAVITRELLAGTTNSAATIRIGSKALLTPSARDFLREHGIRIVRESATPASSAAIRWQAIVVTPAPQIAAALDDLSAGIVCDRRLVGTPTEAAAQATSALCRADAAQIIVFSDQPELVACLANRNDRVRAAAIADSASADRVRRHLKPNLLALDATNKSLYDLKSILKAVFSTF